MKRFSIAILTTLLLNACAAQNTALDAGSFEKGIASGDSVQVLDVRTAGEYNSGHLKNALLADWNNKAEFDRRISFIDKHKPVYVYCLGGGRSAAAAQKLKTAGFEKVYDLSGGINAWKAAGKPVEGKSSSKQMSIAEFDNIVKTPGTVLVDFGAVWCAPCRKMEPVLQSLEKNNPGKFRLVKVDGGNDEEIMNAYNVTALPVFIIFKDGKPVWRKDGIAEEKEIADNL